MPEPKKNKWTEEEQELLHIFLDHGWKYIFDDMQLIYVPENLTELRDKLLKYFRRIIFEDMDRPKDF